MNIMLYILYIYSYLRHNIFEIVETNTRQSRPLQMFVFTSSIRRWTPTCTRRFLGNPPRQPTINCGSFSWANCGISTCYMTGGSTCCADPWIPWIQRRRWRDDVTQWCDRHRNWLHRTSYVYLYNTLFCAIYIYLYFVYIYCIIHVYIYIYTY